MHDRIEHGAIKVIELVGVSRESFDDAVQQAVRKAASSIDEITGVEVLRFSAKADGKNINQYHADVKVAFIVK